MLRFSAHVFTLWVLSVVHASVGFSQDDPPTENTRPIRALLVTGGCCHDYDVQKNLIKKGLETRANIEVTVVHEGGKATDSRISLYEDHDWAKGYDIVLHNECFAAVKDPVWTQRVLSPHQEGLPAVVIHCAMHCYRDGTDEWFKFCGVTSHRHGKHYPHEVLNRDAEHPIMREFPAGWANPAGELYWIEKVWPTAHPLASAKNRERGTEEVCVWTNEYGDTKTRVFGTTLGHHNETVEHPEFLDMLTRGTLWACDKLNDEYLLPPKPVFRPINLALNKPVTSSSVQTNNDREHLTDGERGTRWCAANGSAPQWCQVDLGKTESLTGCELVWESNSAIYKFKVESSVDGESWQVLVDQSENKTDLTNQFDFSTDARYVRVTYLGSNTGAWGSLWELELFGDEQLEVLSADSAEEEKRQAKLAEVTAPDGFDVKLFAAPPAVNYPVFVAAAADGVVYVSVDKNGSLDRELKRGSVYRLRDVDGDGTADEVKLFIADVDSPRGLVWDHDRLYLLHPPHLSAFIDHDGDGISDEQKILVKNIAFTFADRPADHTSNGVTLGIDGWLYLAIGDFGFLQAEGADGKTLQLRGGGVVRVRPDGADLELYSRGTRNILEVGVDPLLNAFARDNTNDGGGWDIRLHHFSGLEDHGYPRLYKNFPEEIVPPLADYGGGSGCGALYLAEPGFPEGYGNALYTADWGRQVIFRHQVSRSGATFKADQTEFLKLPRATDLDVDANSNIYAASWQGATFKYAGEDVGYLVKLTPKGYEPQPLPDYRELSGKDLVEALKSPSHRRRLEAQGELLRRKDLQNELHWMWQLADDGSLPLATRVAAIFTLKQRLGDGTDKFLHVLADKDPTIRAWCIRALGDHEETTGGIQASLLIQCLRDEDAHVRLEAVKAIARIRKASMARYLITMLNDPDPIVAHTVVEALVMLEAVEKCLQAWDDTATATEIRSGVLKVLQRIHTEEVVDSLLERVEAARNNEEKVQLLTALARLYHVEGEWKGNSWGTRPDTRGPYYQPEEWAASERIDEVLRTALNEVDAGVAQRLVEIFTKNRISKASHSDILAQRAETDPAFVPILVIGLSGDRAPTEKNLPLFIKVATDSEFAAELRSKAISILLKDGSSEAFRAALRGLSLLKEAQEEQAFAVAWNALHDRNVLMAHAKNIEALSAANDELSLWSDAALLLLSEQKKLKGDPARVVEQVMQAGWATPDRRVRILHAAVLANHRSFESKIREALSDANPKVAALAKQIAGEWKISMEDAPTGPKVAKFAVKDVIEKMGNLPGKAAAGEQVFAKLGCAKCHTVKPGEALRGPYLPNVAKTYKRHQLAEAVLDPSKSIAQGFVTNLFVLDSGKTVTGFVTNEAATEIVIRDNEGEEIKLSPEEILERAKQDVSSMPAKLADGITLEQFADLMAYLESLAALAEESEKP